MGVCIDRCIMLAKIFLHWVSGELRITCALPILEDTEWPWVALVCMQKVVLMSVGIAPRQKIYVEIAPPSLTREKISEFAWRPFWLAKW